METIWEFYKDRAGDWRWRAIDKHNREPLFASTEGYTDRRAAEHCARRAGWVEGKSLTEEVDS